MHKTKWIIYKCVKLIVLSTNAYYKMAYLLMHKTKWLIYKWYEIKRVIYECILQNGLSTNA